MVLTTNFSLTQAGAWEASICQNLVTNANYDRVGRHLNLDQCVILNPGTTQVSAKSMATTIEAILGAVFLDRGEAAMQGVMSRLGLDHPLLQPVKSNIFAPELL